MDRRCAFVLSLVIIISLYEVLSNNEKEAKAEGEGDDSFKQFEDPDEEMPAYKYSEEAQKEFGNEEEQVLIREPTGHDAKEFKPPINMPPIKFAFCVSCGYRQAYEQFAQILRDKYPGIEVYGENFPPGLVRSLAAQIIGFGKIALIVCVIMGRSPFPALGMETPTFYQWLLNNKMSAALMIFLFSNAVEGMLQSTSAFEIYIEGERIWSKLESGRVPSPHELFQAIDSHIAIRGGATRFGQAAFGIDD